MPLAPAASIRRASGLPEQTIAIEGRIGSVLMVSHWAAAG